MINPRVVNFKPAPVNVSYKNGNISDDRILVNTIRNHFFNFSVSIIFPDSMSVPQTIKDVLTVDAEYYKLISVPLHVLISQDFIDYFIKNGEVTALSVNRLLDTDNSIAITPSGHLILNIDTKTYQELGLVQGPAIEVKKNKNSYFVIINLKTDCFKIGRKNYEKAYENLKNIAHLTFDLILTWEPSDYSVCPSSVAKFFERQNIKVIECTVQEFKRINYGVKFPLLTVEEEELHEWFGAFLFDIRGSESTEDFMMFDDPEPNEEIGQVVLMSWTGLFTSKRMIHFFNEIKLLAARCKEVPWIGFGVLGYLDTPISWGLKPHSFRISGENDYSILINHEGQYSMCRNIETHSQKR